MLCPLRKVMARFVLLPCTLTGSLLLSGLRESEGREATIDEQTGACDVRGFLGSQKQHTRGHFLGRPRTFEHGAGTGLGTVIVQGFAGGSDAAFVKRRENRTWADRINPDTVRGVVQRQATGQARHRGFGGVILE